MKKKLAVRYSMHQMAYWMAAAGIVSFASAFLLEKGFAARTVGVLLASGNLLSCALQPLLAARADRVGGNVLKHLCAALTALCMLCFLSLLLLPLPQWLFGLVYLLGIFTFDAMVPLLNSVCVFYNAQGYRINYGLSRGLGSLAYSAAALVIGRVIADFGGDRMLWIVLLLLAALAVTVLGYPDAAARGETARETDCCSIGEFFLRYKWYCVSLLGVMLLAMFHAMTENFFIRIFSRLGGDSGSVGMALFIATLAEFPVFLWFDRVKARLSTARLLVLSGFSFLLKAVLLLIAPSVTSVYLIQLLQATSYGFLSPTQLYYANERVAKANMVKGQAFITASYTLGCALGNFTGGQLIDRWGVTALLRGGVLAAALGTAILCLTVGRKSAREVHE